MTTPNTLPATGVVSDARLWELRREAKNDPRTADEHWFILFARAAIAEAQSRQPSAQGVEVVAWVRFCSDGTHEGPIMDAALEEVRKRSGAWTPLCVAPPPAGGGKEALETPGNQYPEARYAGYKGRPISPDCPADERAAWQEGHDARADVLVGKKG